MKPRNIRNLYQQLGVQAYYQQYGEQYQNPHWEQIKALLVQNEPQLDYTQVLDFCAGGGEVSWVLRELGYTGMVGSDPYLQALYLKNLGLPCQDWSFETVVKKGITGYYSCIISSFALHLCPADQLSTLTLQLFQATKTLVVLTPHKRPALEIYDGVELLYSDYSLTEKGKKVFLKAYRYCYF